MKQLYLAENQVEAFDTEYHSRKEMGEKVHFIKNKWPRGARVLDLGGGNGKFIDALLDAVPGSHGVNVEISSLAERNTERQDKTVIVGDIADLELHLKDYGQFDVITINWVLHHLIADSYSECKTHCVETLSKLPQLLASGGCIIVAENLYNGFFGTNVPGWMIFNITRIRRPYFLVRLLGRVANTAGVGVCFRSEQSWKHIVRESELRIEHIFYGDYWTKGSAIKRLMVAALFIKARRHGHMYCYPLETRQKTPFNRGNHVRPVENSSHAGDGPISR